MRDRGQAPARLRHTLFICFSTRTAGFGNASATARTNVGTRAHIPPTPPELVHQLAGNEAETQRLDHAASLNNLSFPGRTGVRAAGRDSIFKSV